MKKSKRGEEKQNVMLLFLFTHRLFSFVNILLLIIVCATFICIDLAFFLRII